SEKYSRPSGPYAPNSGQYNDGPGVSVVSRPAIFAIFLSAVTTRIALLRLSANAITLCTPELGSHATPLGSTAPDVPFCRSLGHDAPPPTQVPASPAASIVRTRPPTAAKYTTPAASTATCRIAAGNACPFAGLPSVSVPAAPVPTIDSMRPLTTLRIAKLFESAM